MPSSDTAPPKATSDRSQFQATRPADTASPTRVRAASRLRRAFGQNATTRSRTTPAGRSRCRLARTACLQGAAGALAGSLGGDLGDLSGGGLDPLEQRSRED